MQKLISDQNSPSYQFFSNTAEQMENTYNFTNLDDNKFHQNLSNLNETPEKMLNQSHQTDSQSECISNKAQRMSSSHDLSNSIENNFPLNMSNLQQSPEYMIQQNHGLLSHQEFFLTSDEKMQNSNIQKYSFDNIITESVINQHQFNESNNHNETNQHYQQYFSNQTQISNSNIQTNSNDNRLPQNIYGFHEIPLQMQNQHNEAISQQYRLFPMDQENTNYEFQNEVYENNYVKSEQELNSPFHQFLNQDERISISHNQTNSNDPNYQYFLHEENQNQHDKMHSQSEFSSNQAQRIPNSHFQTNSQYNFPQPKFQDENNQSQIIEKKKRRKKYQQDNIYKGVPQRLCILCKDKPKGKDYGGHLVDLIVQAILNKEKTVNKIVLEIAKTYDKKSNKIFIDHLKNMMENCQNKIDDVYTNSSVDRAVKKIYKIVTKKLNDLQNGEKKKMK